MMQSLAVPNQPSSVMTNEKNPFFGNAGAHSDREIRTLWHDFTPHRLVRRYSHYAWLHVAAGPKRSI